MRFSIDDPGIDTRGRRGLPWNASSEREDCAAEQQVLQKSCARIKLAFLDPGANSLQ
jgi:hypothetical protein